MNLHRFFFRSQHNTLIRLGIELDKSLARVVAIDRETNIKQMTITHLGKEASALKARVAEFDHSLADAMDQLEAIQGTSQVHIDRVAELESGFHEVAASLPVHESKDIDADNVDDVCRAVKMALRRYADQVERVEARAEAFEKAIHRARPSFEEMHLQYPDKEGTLTALFDMVPDQSGKGEDNPT